MDGISQTSKCVPRKSLWHYFCPKHNRAVMVCHSRGNCTDSPQLSEDSGKPLQSSYVSFVQEQEQIGELFAGGKCPD